MPTPLMATFMSDVLSLSSAARADGASNRASPRAARPFARRAASDPREDGRAPRPSTFSLIKRRSSAAVRETVIGRGTTSALRGDANRLRAAARRAFPAVRRRYAAAGALSKPLRVALNGAGVRQRVVHRVDNDRQH